MMGWILLQRSIHSKSTNLNIISTPNGNPCLSPAFDLDLQLILAFYTLRHLGPTSPPLSSAGVDHLGMVGVGETIRNRPPETSNNFCPRNNSRYCVASHHFGPVHFAFAKRRSRSASPVGPMMSFAKFASYEGLKQILTAHTLSKVAILAPLFSSL
jgi:hypothetical protein